MANGRAHGICGAITGGGTAVALATTAADGHPILEGLAGALAGYVGGRLPDWLEPSTTPLHRGLCHSMALAGGGGAAVFAYLARAQSDLRARAARHGQASQRADDFMTRLLHELARIFFYLLAGALAGLTVGYASHLVLDLPRRGLPLVCRSC